MVRMENENTGTVAMMTAKRGDDKTINMSKREWFAGIAMQALISSPVIYMNYENTAIEALRYADALIKKLEEDV